MITSVKPGKRSDRHWTPEEDQQLLAFPRGRGRKPKMTRCERWRSKVRVREKSDTNWIGRYRLSDHERRG